VATVLTLSKPPFSNILSMSNVKYSSEKGSVLFISKAMGLGRPWMTGDRGSLSVMASVPPEGGRKGGRVGGRDGGREGGMGHTKRGLARGRERKWGRRGTVLLQKGKGGASQAVQSVKGRGERREGHRLAGKGKKRREEERRGEERSGDGEGRRDAYLA